MKNIYLIFILFFPIFCFTQVGVGTVSPEKDLHIEGDTSTIRLEGLSGANNPLNQVTSYTRVFIDEDGTLTLDDGHSGNSSILFLTDASNVFEDIVVAENINNSSTTTNIYSYQFTLNAKAFVEIKYSLSYKVFDSYDPATKIGVKILDGVARQIKTYFTINGVSPEYGQISHNFYNMHPGGGDGFFYNNGSAYLPLSKGTHTINFYAHVAGSVNNTTSVVLGGNDDLLKIRVYQ